MAANYWNSSQCAVIESIREEDARFAPKRDVFAIATWCCQSTFEAYAAITLLCGRLKLRQRVIATASVYFHRFYSRNTYASTDPFLLLTTCVYLASKVEEAAVRIRVVCAEASKMFMDMGYLELSNCIPLVAEMEFYLLEELDFDAIVFHPYPLLQQLCDACSAALFHETEENTFRDRDHKPKLNSGSDSSVELGNSAYSRQLYQMTWLVTNDMYRTTLPLLYPPYVTAIASLYLSVVLLPTGSMRIESAVLDGSHIDEPTAIVRFFGGLNVSNVVIADVVQAMLSYYHEWHDLQAPSSSESPSLIKNPASIFARVHQMHSAYRDWLLSLPHDRPA